MSSPDDASSDHSAGVWMQSVYRRGRLADTDLEDAPNAAAVVEGRPDSCDTSNPSEETQ